MSGPTLRRLRKYLEILPTLHRHSGATVEEMRRLTRLSRAELDEALRTLSLCGLPPYDPASLIDAWIENGRVFIDSPADIFSRHLRLARDEAAALCIAGQIALAGRALDPHARSALAKVREALRPDAQASAEAVDQRLHIEPETGGVLPILYTLQRAARLRRKLDIEHFAAARQSIASRRVRPYGLIFYVANWYLVAWCELRKGERLFRVDRIKSVETTEETFDVPDDFNLDDFRETRMFKAIRRDHEVVLRFDPPHADAAEARWPRESRRRRDGSTAVTFLVESVESFLPTALAHGDAAIVESPPELLELLRDTALKLQKKYK